MTGKSRLLTLDAIRGLAAFTVVIDHALVSFPLFLSVLGHAQVPQLVALFGYSPLHFFWAGHEAVVLFFVLSGFVLSLPYLDGPAPGYWNYALKRIVRIYVPYAVAILLSSALRYTLSPQPIGGLSSWFNLMWSQPVTPRVAVDLAFMLGEYNHQFVTSTWSLVHEMHVSLFFPVLAVLVGRRHWAWTGALVGVALLGSFLGRRLQLPLPESFFYSLYTITFFLVGSLAAKYRAVLTALTAKLSRLQEFGLLFVAMYLYLWTWLMPPSKFLTNGHVGDAAVTIGSLLFIFLALGAPGLTGYLRSPWLQWLGRVSYSLYLIHPLILLLFVHTLGGRLPLWFVVALVPFASLGFAELFHRLVEEPAIRLGRSLSSRITKRDRTDVAGT